MGKLNLVGLRLLVQLLTPHCILSIYNVVIDGLVKRAVDSNITRVATVANFGPCFSVRNVVWSKGGPSAPVIDLEVEAGCGTSKSGVTWRIIGANSMGSVNKGVMCLGFKDEEGRKPL
uniref:Xylanase inhibitor C-terminal domain-containing protein n=1 Tax=Cannabis sativa TaxID=3483 RepID=A0A803Q242_CANSA